MADVLQNLPKIEVSTEITGNVPSELRSILLRAGKGKVALSRYLLQHTDDKESAEAAIRHDLKQRDDKIGRCMRYLKDEMDNVLEEHRSVQKCMEDAVKVYWKLQKLIRVSSCCLMYRRTLEDERRDEVIRESLKAEAIYLQAAIDDILKDTKNIREALGKIEHHYKDLDEDLYRKLVAHKYVKICHYNSPLPSAFFNPEEGNSENLNREMEWEDDMRKRVQKSITNRSEAREICGLVISTIGQYASEISTKWMKINEMLNDEIYANQYTVDVLRKVLGMLDKVDTETCLRLNQFHDELDMQTSQKKFHFWRMQLLNQRLGSERLQDDPVVSLSQEIVDIEERMNKIMASYDNEGELLNDIVKLRGEQTEKLETVKRRLIVNRSCYSVRMTVDVDNLSYGNF